jgi:penicillin-binding protein 1A
MTKVLDNKGNVIGIFAHQKRTLIPYGDIPKAFQGAIIAAEDADFWTHGGVSSRGFFGALYRGAKSFGKNRSGFSTLTMQLVRTVTEKRERNILKGAFLRKMREIIVAIRLEKALTKQQIMEQYANEVNFGAGYYGIEAASQYYFRKSALELSIEESALLAALVQRPSRSHDRLFSNDPKEREVVRNRRNYVISRMASEGYLRESDAELLMERPIRLGRENAGEEDIAAYAVEEVRKALEPKYGKERLMEGGFEIHTTIDSLWQQAATDAVQKGLRTVERRRGFRIEAVRFYENPETARDPSWQRFYEPGDTARGIIMGWSNDYTATVRLDSSIVKVPSSAFAWAGKPAQAVLIRGAAPLFTIKETYPDGAPKSLELDQIPEVEGALLAVDSRTGEIRAMVGGYNFRRSQFNRTTQAFRQVGSSMKAFVYGAALLQGFTPATIVDDTPTNFQFGMTSYEPRNYENNFLGPLTLWEALAHSRNIPAVKVLEMAGIDTAAIFAANCGITSYIPPYPSMALGATDLTLKELVRAYATISAGGHQCPEPFLIKKVIDRDGRVLEEKKPTPIEPNPIIDPVVNFQLIQMLQGVTSSGTAGGTSAALNWPVAGKTGTTNDHTDAWFMGFSSRVTCGVWVGLDAKKTIHSDASGGKTALPIWTSFMKAVLPTTPREDFKPPEGLEWIDLDIDTGLRAGSATNPRRMRSIAFRPGTGPRDESDYEAIARLREAKARVKYAETVEHIWGAPQAVIPLLERPSRIIDPNDY